MKNQTKKIVTCLVLSFCITIINAQVNKISKVKSSRIETIMHSFLDQTKVPGISIAVSVQGELIYCKGYGYSNKELGLSMDTESKLRTASVAKVITATALGKLMSDGKLNLDEPIKTYVPYIEKKYENLTARQLASHTSGLAHRPKGNSYKKKQFDNIKETVGLMNSNLLFKPDTDFKYSTHAFNFLAAVVEGASGKKYIDYLNEDIFIPLGMKNTYPENINQLSQDDAQLYFVDKLKAKREKVTNGSYKLPGAGFRSTPTDMVRMMDAYRTGFITSSVVNEMFKSHSLKNGHKVNTGVVWRLSFDSFGNKVIEHAGNWLGARTVVVYYPEKELTISLMINASCSILIEETAHLLSPLYLEEYMLNAQISA